MLGTLSAVRLSLAERRAAAAALRSRRDAIAGVANMALTARHPAWRQPAAANDAPNDTAVANALDAARHIDFLAGALEVGETKAFVDYVAWLSTMLAAWGVVRNVAADSLALIRPGTLMSVEGAARTALDHLLQAGVARARAAQDPVATSAPGSDPAFLRAILAGDRSSALREARAALRASTLSTGVYIDLFQKGLTEVGARWQDNRITVAQEHLATATAQFVLAQLQASVDHWSPRRGVALITGVEGERHQVGANLVADALEADGWEVRFLGSDMPHAGIVEAAHALSADLIGVSATMLYSVNATARLIEDLRGARRLQTPRILVGGGAFRAAPKLWREVGADDYAADVRQVGAAARGEKHLYH